MAANSSNLSARMLRYLQFGIVFALGCAFGVGVCWYRALPRHVDLVMPAAAMFTQPPRGIGTFGAYRFNETGDLAVKVYWENDLAKLPDGVTTVELATRPRALMVQVSQFYGPSWNYFFNDDVIDGKPRRVACWFAIEGKVTITKERRATQEATHRLSFALRGIRIVCEKANAELLLGDVDLNDVDAGRRRDGALDEAEPLAAIGRTTPIPRETRGR